MLKRLLLVAITGASLNVQAGSLLDYQSAYQCDGEAKFNWYCEEQKQPAPKVIPKKPVEEEQKTEKEAEAPLVKPIPEVVKPPEIQEFANIQERLKELLQIAYVNPTDENIYNYIEYQNKISNKAAVFADKWQRVLWISPELDYSQRHPTASMAKAVNRKQIREKREFNLEHLKAQGYGIFFFYRSDCQYCHQMSYPLKLLGERSKLDVMSISVDGVIVDKFPNSVVDNGQAAKLGVTQTPTVMLINTETKDIQPISTGWVSLQELEKRIYILTATKPGENY